MRKELNIPIPDSVLIKTSRLTNKAEIVQAIEDEQNGPDAQKDKEIDQAERMAEVKVKESDAARNNVDAQVKSVKVMKDRQDLAYPIPPETALRVKADLAKSKYETDEKTKVEYAKIASAERIAKISAAAKPKATPVKAKPKKAEPKKGK
jgi:hypothetical protein